MTALDAKSALLVSQMEGAGCTRLIAHFEHRAEGGTELGGYELYLPWDHGRSGVLYVEAPHVFVAKPIQPGDRKIYCARCGEGPRDGDHYGTNPDMPAEDPEPGILAAAAALLEARFAGSTSAAGVLKVDTEARRLWFDLGHEHVPDDETDTGLRVEL